jgi:hypothetical protein
MLGGQSGDRQGVFNDVWSSDDGKKWVQETAAAPWQGRHSFGAFVAPGTSKLCIIGGLKDSSMNPLNDMWSTTDGKNWVQETSAAFTTPRLFIATAVLNNKVWLVGTNADESSPQSLWQSSDGKTWQKIEAKGDLLPKLYSKAFAISGALYTLSMQPGRNLFSSIGITSITTDGSFSMLGYVPYDDIVMGANFIEYNGCLWALNIFRSKTINDQWYSSPDIWVYAV